MIIGFVGLARAGKDSAAKTLIQKFGFTRVSFADPLKQIAYDIDPLIANDTHLAEVVDEQGWEIAKDEYPECRRFLQRIGTEGLRKNVDNDFWVNLALSKMKNADEKNYVITDMRFLNEYEKVRDFATQGGALFSAWRIQRDGLSVMGHASELEMATIPTEYTVSNNETLEHLDSIVEALYHSLTV